MTSRKSATVTLQKIRHEISIGISTIETAKSGLLEKPGNPESASDLHALGVEKIHQVLEYLDQLTEAAQ